MKGDSSTTPNLPTSSKNIATTNTAKKLFGLAWYWWTLIVLAILVVIYAVYYEPVRTRKIKQQISDKTVREIPFHSEGYFVAKGAPAHALSNQFLHNLPKTRANARLLTVPQNGYSFSA